jgi:epoxyqueuosine reductase
MHPMQSADVPVSSNSSDERELSAAVREEAVRLGFDLVGIAPAVSPKTFPHLEKWLNQGYAGEMEYLAGRRDAYEHPGSVLRGVQSVVVAAMNYRTREPQQTIDCGEARVSRYAWGPTDYHRVVRERLRQLGDYLHKRVPGCRTRAVVDTAPLLERDFARLAGLGWFGKNTMLINKRVGSWLFLGALLTDVALAADARHGTDHCGTCTRCLDACPTDAFTEPYVLDARRCISYLTIELRDRPIPVELRDGVGDWLFGCDVCQDVCPWNRKAPASSEAAFEPRADLSPVDCAAVLKMTAAEFEEQFGETPLARPGRAGVLRNACIVLGNSGDQGALPPLMSALRDEEPLVRGAAAWALGRIGGQDARVALESHAAVEDNPEVAQEIRNALRQLLQAKGNIDG